MSWYKNNLEFIQSILLYFGFIISHYYLPIYVSITIQAIILLFYFRSKKDYFWIAFTFVLVSQPGNLLAPNTSDISFSIMQSSDFGSLYFWVVFLIVGFVKHLKTRLSYRPYYSSLLFFLFIYFIFLLLIFGVWKSQSLVRGILPWLWFFIIPRSFKTEDEIKKFFKILFPYLFIVFLTQAFSIVFGTEISSIFMGRIVSQMNSDLSVLKEEAFRPVFGITISFLGLFGAGYYLVKRSLNSFEPSFLEGMLILASLSIFISATRSWFVATVCFLISVFTLSSTSLLRMISRLILPTLIVLFLTLTIPFLNKQISLSLSRYSTLESFASGDLSAGGTAKRFDIRAPRVMNKFGESPLIGNGYSDDAIEYSDGHVGYQNLLMHTGIIGLLLYVLFWGSLVTKMIEVNKRYKYSANYKRYPLLLIAFLISTLIINSSAEWYAYILGPATGFISALLYHISQLAVNDNSSLKVVK